MWGQSSVANYSVLWVSAHDENGNSTESTCPSLSWDRKKRIMEFPGGGDIYRKNFPGKNELVGVFQVAGLV